MSSTVAVIGLGIMGSPMAVNLAHAGYDVAGFNRSPEKTAALVEAGGRHADSVAEAVKGADVIVTMLPDSPDVETIVTEPGGLLENASSGALWIDASTIRPDVAVSLAERASAAGLRPLDAPVSGGEQGAIDGALSIMVGGTEDDFAAAEPVLDVVGATIVHVGPSGSGQTVKAANQLIVAGTIGLVAESLVFLQAYGVDTEAAIKVLAGGLAGNRILDRKASSMVSGDFQPGFRIDLHHKDMGIVTSAAREAGVAIPLSAQTAQLIQATKALGHGNLDHSALMLAIQQLSASNQADDATRSDSQ